MLYESTRGQAPRMGFDDVLLAGLASDGGLYWPESFPQISADELRAMRGQSYTQIAQRIFTPFVGDCFSQQELSDIIGRAYAGFDHAEIAPLRQLGPNQWVMELFHGPTFAFKDVAMQLLGPLFDTVLERRKARVTIVGATSGDTGSAAIEAFRGRDHADVVILHPHGRTSDVQRRQMTTVADANVHNIAIEGTFDDCQALVKQMFAHRPFADAVSMSGVNSINWARVMAQIVYYVTAAVSLGAPDRPVSFTVPTGNFGDILAGYVAKKMGVPIDQLIIATNSNDILKRTLETGRYEVTGVVPTASPSMDIQVSSNFERLLYETHDRQADTVARMMAQLGQSGAFSLEVGGLAQIRKDFAAGRADERDTGRTIARTLEQAAMLIDPHTAVGVHVANQVEVDRAVPMVVLATAHPAKFPDAVKQASGHLPAAPARLEAIMQGEERYTVLPNDLDAVMDFIRKAVA